MAITYSYTIHAVRVTAETDLTDVVKEVDCTVVGTDSGCQFSLPYTVKMGAADPEAFTPYEELTEAQILSWIEADEALTPVKEHVAFVLEREVAKAALASKPLPWAPEPSVPTLPAPVAPDTE